MKKILIYSLIIISAGVIAWGAWLYFRPVAEIEITEVQTDIEEEDAVEAITTEDDDDDSDQLDITGRTGFTLEFEGTKLRTRIGRANITTAYGAGNDYEIRASVRTAGILNKLFSDRIRLTSSGISQDGKMIADIFSNATVKSGKNAEVREKIHHLDGNVWTYTRRGNVREVDMKIYDMAMDPLVILIQVGHLITTTGNCDFKYNAFMDETGFIIESRDRGTRKESGIKSGGKIITEHRCDITVRNRAGKVQKDFPFDHEFARKNKNVREAKIHVYYSKMGGDVFVPVFVRAVDTPVGNIDIKLTRIRRF